MTGAGPVTRAAGLVLLLLSPATPVLANREGWADARQKALRLERRSQWAEAAAWWDAAAESLERVSLPLSTLGIEEAGEDGDPGALAWWTEGRAEDERLLSEARERRDAAARKGGGISEEERLASREVLARWARVVERDWWEWERMDLRMDSRRSAAGDELGAWELEAIARERWSARIEKIAVPTWELLGEAAAAKRAREAAAEQRDLAQKARVRIAGRFAQGWSADTLRKNVTSGNEDQRRDAVAKLALRGDRVGLRLALRDDSPDIASSAARALAAVRDVEGLALARNSPALRDVLGSPFALRDGMLAPESVVLLLAASEAAATDLSGPAAEELLRLFAAEGLRPPKTSRQENPARAVLPDFEGMLRPGAAARAFKSLEPEGDPEHLTVEDVEFDWGAGGPAGGAPADDWRLHIAAFLLPESDLVAELIAHCDDCLRVRVDGRLVIDEWSGCEDVRYRRAPVVLEKGWHSLYVEYGDVSGPAQLKMWLAPGRDQVLPLGPLLRRFPEKAK